MTITNMTVLQQRDNALTIWGKITERSKEEEEQGKRKMREKIGLPGSDEIGQKVHLTFSEIYVANKHG